MTPYYEHNGITIYHGDCLEKMHDIPDGSVDMVLTDPPYGTIKGVGDGDIDHGLKGKILWDKEINHSEMLAGCNRVLRPNAALVLFSQDPYTAKLMTETNGNLPFSYRYTWKKDHFANSLIAKKAPVNYTEDVCVFFKRHNKHDFNGLHPLREYACKLFAFIGKNKKQIFNDLGNQSICHFMRVDSTQFQLCTEQTYNQITDLYDLNSQNWFIPFVELQDINTEYRRNLIKKMTSEHPKTFNLETGKKYKSNILEYKKDYMGLHPTQKPVALIEDLIKTYTNESETVLDFTMGSGTTGVACHNTGRDFIGIEMDNDYFNIAKERIEKAQTETICTT